MSRANLARAVLACVILGTAVYLTITSSPRLGLDLRGGTQIVLETKDTSTTKADAEATDRTVEVLRRRIDALGVTEPTITRSGSNRIIVELPGVQDPAEAAAVIGRTAQLTVRPVLGYDQAGATPAPDASSAPSPGAAPSTAPPTPAPSASSPAEPGTGLTLTDESGAPLRLGPAALTGEGIADAAASFDATSGLGWFVTVDFRGAGERAWETVTGDAACFPSGDPQRRVAIVLDQEIVSAPQVGEDVRCNVGITGGSTQITGSFSKAEANDLALLVKAGALPVPVETVEQRTVGPTLGADAIRASAQAAVIGVALTIGFLLLVYRLSGLVAAIALAGYGVLSYGVLTALGATLTLPGLAGFVLAIGMAIDGCVLIFERSREEVSRGLRAAVGGGFKNSLSAIADSNVTTLLAAGLLFWLASGPVRGFGVTLSIGVLASMVSALLFTRVLMELLIAVPWVRRHPAWTGLAGPGRVQRWITRRNFDLMRHRRVFLTVSGVLVVVALIGIFGRGLNLGVEFTGGRLMEYTTSSPVSISAAREAVADAGFPRAVVVESGDSDLSVRTGQISDESEQRIRAALETVGGSVERVRDEQVGPSLGSELRVKALIGLGVALLAQVAYLAIRFRWTFAVSSVVAMLHDVVIVVGLFAWLGKSLDGVFLAALLTVIGYSVNDSVVIFDRVRERWRGAARRTPFADVANEAVLQTVPRTVNTGLGALFILTALAVLGGDSLTDFAIALLVGVVVGTASSALTATPLAVVLESRWPGRSSRPSVAKKPVRTGSGAVV
ncbi:protein translocase subunit SecD [Cryptosporangium phraense]|uniref:Multifunctional fusion protein n=1 Tax=Cryptosporangium phraense TaxID=2593070 RepID=A0A545AT06_9ACTN|nr:protein translocase subunit SecD [Cryptosporangium phraense]TQS44458.1 protein translocase subunit SecD [Cryptosporangium phraense]